MNTLRHCLQYILNEPMTSDE